MAEYNDDVGQTINDILDRSHEEIVRQKGNISELQEKKRLDIIDENLKELTNKSKVLVYDDLAYLRHGMDINSHLTFVENLLKRHKLGIDRRRYIILSVQNIRNKDQNPNLYLGIIGEFSSGKSSFINSIIRDDLLRTDVLPATTASATIINYGTELDIIVKYKDKTSKSYKQVKKGTELKAFLHQVTADDAFAKEIDEVTVYHPSEFLKKNLVIIDTPGINVNNERHIQVTIWAIQICDAAIILIPANIPVSQTLTDFLMNYLSDVLHRCIFVVTKMDLIQYKERERLLKYIKDRLRSALDLKLPTVLVSTPLFILDELVENRELRISDDKQNLINQSLRTEKEIYRILQEQRILILLERLSNLLFCLFSELRHDLHEIEKSYMSRYQTLEKNRIIDLELYIKQEKDLHNVAITNQSLYIFDEIKEKIGNLKKNVLLDSRLAIYQGLKGDIRLIVACRYSDAMQNLKEITQKSLIDFFKISFDIGNQRLEMFEEDFKVLYKSLATLGGHLSDKEEKDISKSLTVDKCFNEFHELIDIETTKEYLKVDGNVIAGAAIGTLIFPVIGTIVGAAIGALFNSETVDKVRKKYWDIFQKAINESFFQVEEDTMKIAHGEIENVMKEFNKIIDCYFEHYYKLVREMVEHYEVETNELTKFREIIKEDLNQLESRQQQLNLIKEKLRLYKGDLYVA